MPLYEDALDRIRFNLMRIQAGERVALIEIGCFTETQFIEINSRRDQLELHLLEKNEIVFIGKHVLKRRSEDGYTIDDMIDQIVSALSINSVVDMNKFWSRMDNPVLRADRYGNMVSDRAVFEMTARKPRAELFSVMPKGDNIKPVDTKKPT